MIRLGLIIGIMLSLMACTSGGNRGLRDLRSSGGAPDEFRVNPVNPLVLPTDVTNLPTPTPGGTNLTDPTPQADAVAILGGNSNTSIAGGLPARDVALVSAAGRNGVDPAIRQTLASEDAAFRARRSRFGFLRRGDRYFSAYARQALDAHAELQRFRAAGIATPSAPPR